MPQRSKPTQVTPGAWVKVRGLEEGETEVFRLIESGTADLTANEIPVSSPFAQAIMGKAVGETVEYRAPGGLMTVEIIEISFG